MTEDASEGVKVYPNPFRPKLQPYVVFDNVSDDAVIGVYNRGGKLVTSLRGNDIAGGRAEWDGKMKNGSFVAPGVYQYVIRGGSKTKKGKLLIVH
jgi:flagellar hook assembly protein FlgD